MLSRSFRGNQFCIPDLVSSFVRPILSPTSGHATFNFDTGFDSDQQKKFYSSYISKLYIFSLTCIHLLFAKYNKFINCIIIE